MSFYKNTSAQNEIQELCSVFNSLNSLKTFLHLMAKGTSPGQCKHIFKSCFFVVVSEKQNSAQLWLVGGFISEEKKTREG